MCSRCNRCNQHSFNDTMWFSLHHGTIHKCPGITFITVADNVFFFHILVQDLLPFSSSRESAASTATEGCLAHFIYDLLWCHIKQCFCDSTVTTESYVFCDAFRIDASAVLQCNTCLLFIKWNIFLFYIRFQRLIGIYQTLYHFIPNNTLFYNFFTVFYPYFQVKPAHRFDTEQWTHFTKAMTAAFL